VLQNRQGILSTLHTADGGDRGFRERGHRRADIKDVRKPRLIAFIVAK
jgi:hypothetical protein